MANNQETLIYIEQENKTEAEFMSRSFINEETKNRVYINTIGAEAMKKYLTTEGIDCSEVFSIHSISKIIEKFDIADIILPNIHIDTRVVFDNDQIFIPKSHSELNIEPDIYAILKLDKSFSHVELLGYIKPSQINKNNQNEKYYFIEKSDLEPAQTLSNYIKNYVGNTDQDITEEEFFRGRELSISLADHNITKSEEIELIELLLTNRTLRESVLEFDNFETLSYSAASTVIEISQPNPEVAGLTLADMSMNEELEIEETFPEMENFDSELEEESIETDIETQYETVSEETEEFEETLDTDSITTLEEDSFNTVENISIEEQYIPEQIEELSVDAILDDAIAAIDTPDKEVETDINIDLDEAASATAEALANAVASAEETSTTISDEAIKLASLSGEIVNDVVQSIEDDQQKNLDRIDYEKTDIHFEIGETPEYILAEAENLHSAKQEANLEAEQSGQFEIPMNITDLNTVDTYEEKEFIQESVDFGAIESVDNEILELNAKAPLENDVLTDLNLNEEIETLPEISGLEEDVITDITTFDSETLEENIDVEDLNIETTFEEEIEIKDINAEQDFENTETLLAEETFDTNINTEELTLPEENITDTNLPENNLPLDENALDFSSCLKPSTRRKDEAYSDSSDKPTIDEETKKALFANNIVSDSSDDNEEVDFGETIVIPDDEEPFNIEDDTTFNNELTDEITYDENIENNSTEVIEDLAELLDEFPTEDETTSLNETFNDLDDNSIIEENSDELTLDDLDMLSENPEEETQSPEDFFKDYEEPTAETFDDEEFLSSAEGFESKMFDFEETEEQQNEQETITAEDWMGDTDYENLEDVEIQTTQNVGDFTDNNTQSLQTSAVIENSKVISDKTFQAGEIQIDINTIEAPQYTGHESLENIYDPNANFAGESLIQNPGRLGPAQNRNSASGFLGFIGALIVLAIVGGIGFGVAKLFKAPTEEAPQPITDEPIPTSMDNGVTETNTLKIDPNNVVKMDTPTNKPVATQTTTKQVAKSQTPTTVSSNTTQKKGKATTFIEIKKLTWEVPDYISYNQQFKQYFQSVGKSLKLTLTSDLLLATDYLYSDNMRIGLTFAKDGTFQNSQIIVSSGSNQIDKIVLQTVNQTLKALKAPNSVGNDENTTAVLKIYF